MGLHPGYRGMSLGGIVVMHLQQQATGFRPEGSVLGARRATGVGERVKRRAAVSLRIVAHGEVARDEKHLFPIVMHERFCRVDVRLEAKQTGAAAALAGLVERTGKDLLRNAARVAGRRLPAGAQVDGVELVVPLVDRHRVSPFAYCELNSMPQPFTRVVSTPASARHFQSVTATES